MHFNSIAFLIFLPVVWSLYHALRGANTRACLLLVASYVFYMWWRIDFVLLLLFSTLVDYACGMALGKSERLGVRRAILGVSIAVNLTLLATFKYFSFFIGEITSLGHLFGAELDLPALDLLLPMGISFYTFQTMSYTIEVYRRGIKPESNLIRFALYVSFFPQLVAGPIERPQRLLPQIRSPQSVDPDQLVAGLRLMLWGMFKKIVVADRLAVYVDLVYSSPTGHGGAHLILATVFFAVQIYCDFSGYTDIAIGCARTLGFDLMTNFRRPYLAWCPTEFWKRWHISLSTWFRDYVYIPLGGSRGGAVRAGLALMTTFLLSGLWHGASRTFLAWGAIHGLMVLIERLIRKIPRVAAKPAEDGSVARLISASVSIPCLLGAWIFFRAASMDDATYIISHLFSGLTLEGLSCGLGQDFLVASVGLIAVVIGFDLWEEAAARGIDKPLWAALPTPVRWCGYWTLATCTLLFGQLESARQFIYFQF